MLCNMYGGEILNEFAFGDSERSPPHLFLYLPYSKEKKWKQQGTLPVLTPGSLNFIKSKNITIWSTNFLFYFIYILFYINFDVFILFFLFIIYFLSWQAKQNV